MQEIVGKLHCQEAKIAIVIARFNETITRSLLQGAIECAERSGISKENLTIVWVPGAFEIPVMTKRLAASKKFDAVITIGAVIRGGTSHFDYVAGPCASGVSQVAIETGVPCIFGVLTLDTIEQGLQRAGTTHGNKGFEAMQAAIEMCSLFSQIETSSAKTYATN